MMADKVDSRSDPRSITDHQQVEKTRTLIFALNLISLNLPLPSDVLRTVSSIYFSGDNEDEDDGDGGGATQGVGFKSCTGFSKVGDLLTVFKDALLKQRLNHVSSMGLEVAKKIRLQSNTHHRVTELEELSSIRGEDLQMKCLLELYGLKLAELQTKVRADVSSEYCLLEKCANPDKELFNWGLMRLHHPFFLYGMGDAFVTEVNDHQHKKCDKERLPRIEEEKKKRLEIRKRKFFAEMLDIAHEHQFLVQSALKHRKQRNVDIQAWHARQRHHATRIEKSRFQALKSDDLESYLKMVEESKNERLATLLSKTNDLLARLGAAVKRQKDTVHSASFDAIRGLESEDLSELSLSKSVGPSDMLPKEDIHIDDRGSNSLFRTPDLLEGQRQYNSVVHSEREQVTEQPSMLQGGELRPYQLEGLQWMLSLFNNHLNGILADEMGLGKTIQTIAFLAYLMEKKNVVGPHLIVAPKAVLSNWVTEFSTWAPSILAILYDGLIEERKAMRNEFSAAGKFNVMITHYDLIIRDNAFLRKFHWQYVIVDEGHRLKSSACTLARTLVSGYNIRRRLLLTGTPIQNTLKELWALLKFILPSVFNSVQNFEEWFNAPFANRADGSLTNEEELLIIRRLHQVIRPFILRRKKDEVEKNLPGKTQVVLKSDMSAWQKVYYRQVTQEGRVGMVSKNGKPSSLQNLTMQLRKCCNHPYLFVRDHNMWSRQEIVRASGKFELLDRLLPKLQRAGHRVLLFSQMTRLMDILEIYMQIQEFKYLRLDGSTKTEKRATLLQQFNKPDSPFFIFLLSTRAGGLGLNLQTADTVIIFDSDWNPQMDQQAEDRAHRIGQRKEVRVFVLVSVGSVEEVILECTQQKKEIDAKVIQAGLFNTTSTAKERKEMLQEIMKRGTSSLSSDIPSEREMNRLAARSEEEFNLFEKMEEERRQRENYKSRLMEEHEVPDWVYLPQEKKVNIGKRRQREEMEVRSDDMLGNSNRSEDWSNNILPWKIHKKKRSLLVPR